MDKSPTNPHYHTLDGCTFIYTYIQNTQIIVAQFLHMGELTPQQLTKSQIKKAHLDFTQNALKICNIQF